MAAEARKLLGDSSDDDNSGENSCVDAGFVVGTNDIIERFFSHCGLVLTKHRESFSPFMFECVMFLKANRKFWGVNDISAARTMKEAETKEADFYVRNLGKLLEELNLSMG